MEVGFRTYQRALRAHKTIADSDRAPVIRTSGFERTCVADDLQMANRHSQRLGEVAKSRASLCRT